MQARELPPKITTLLKEVSDPNAGLSNVLGITQELIKMINQMRENNDQFSFLVEHILGFLKNLSKETARLNKHIRDGSPTRRSVLQTQKSQRPSGYSTGQPVSHQCPGSTC